MRQCQNDSATAAVIDCSADSDEGCAVSKSAYRYCIYANHWRQCAKSKLLCASTSEENKLATIPHSNVNEDGFYEENCPIIAAADDDDNNDNDTCNDSDKSNNLIDRLLLRSNSADINDDDSNDSKSFDIKKRSATDVDLQANNHRIRVKRMKSIT